MSFPRHQFAIEAHKSSITQITCYSPELQTKSTQHYHLTVQSTTELKPPSLAVYKMTLLRIRHTAGFNADLQHWQLLPQTLLRLSFTKYYQFSLMSTGRELMVPTLRHWQREGSSSIRASFRQNPRPTPGCLKRLIIFSICNFTAFYTTM